MAIIGANTDPIRYRKSTYCSIGVNMARRIPANVTATAVHFSSSFGTIVWKLTPAEKASRKVVVTVAAIMI